MDLTTWALVHIKRPRRSQGPAGLLAGGPAARWQGPTEGGRCSGTRGDGAPAWGRPRWRGGGVRAWRRGVSPVSPSFGAGGRRAGRGAAGWPAGPCVSGPAGDSARGSRPPGPLQPQPGWCAGRGEPGASWPFPRTCRGRERGFMIKSSLFPNFWSGLKNVFRIYFSCHQNLLKPHPGFLLAFRDR